MTAELAMAVAAVDPARLAATKGEFGKVYAGKRLRPGVQDKLAAYFAGREGETVSDLRQFLVVDKNDEEEWKEVWKGTMSLHATSV